MNSEYIAAKNLKKKKKKKKKKMQQANSVLLNRMLFTI